MRQLKLVVICLLVSEILIVQNASAQIENKYRTYFFTPGSIVQMLVYTEQTHGIRWLTIYTNPEIEGDGILILKGELPFLMEVAAQIKSGVITGVAYDIVCRIEEMNPLYFMKDKYASKDAYEITGYYYMTPPPGAGANTGVPMTQMNAVMIPANIPSSIPDLNGTWLSNMGVTYRIEQTGTVFSWEAKSLNQTASGTIGGKTVHATWSQNGLPASANGNITQTDAQNRAKVIVWDNGVTFTRLEAEP